MARLTALYDACVLYPAQLRDLLIELAATDLFQARWTDEIHDEWIRSVIRDKPGLKERLNRTRQLMDVAVEDCLIEGYENLIPALDLPDPNDRHVLAAAIKGRVDVIVTFNLSDFPKAVLGEFNIDAQAPDEFILHLLDLSPRKVCRAARAVRSRLKNPPMDVDTFLQSLQKSKLSETVQRLKQMKDNL